MNIHTDKENTRVAKELKIVILNSFGIFLLLAIFLFTIDFVPELQTDTDSSLASQTKQFEDGANALTDTEESSISLSSNKDVDSQINSTIVTSVPVRITIEKIGLDTPILAPESTDIEVLDRALLNGAVHYPGSGLLGQNANMLLFGHSSYLPVVRNQAYKAFNELGKLKKGDTISVYSNEYTYSYTVDKVWLAEAGDTQVHFDSNEPMLTLATCDNFGAKQDRWVVTATLDSKEKIN